MTSSTVRSKYFLQKHVGKAQVWKNMLGKNDHHYSQPTWAWEVMVRSQMVLGVPKTMSRRSHQWELGRWRWPGSGLAAGSSRQHLLAGPYKGVWNRNWSRRRWVYCKNTYLQSLPFPYMCAALPIRKKSLFFLPLNLGSPWDMLWSTWRCMTSNPRP